MDKQVLKEYIDARELIKETKADIRRLEKKQNTIIQTNVSGSNPDFPYEPKHFKIQGTTITYREDRLLRIEKKLLEERRANAEKLKQEVEAWMNTIPMRMQRIIRYKFFEELTWQQVQEKTTVDCLDMTVMRVIISDLTVRTHGQRMKQRKI